MPSIMSRSWFGAGSSSWRNPKRRLRQNREARWEAVDDSGSEVLLVVDECRNIGSEEVPGFALQAPQVLGLSATPEMGDREGTARVFRLLGPTVHGSGSAMRCDDPYSPYEYHIRTVGLTRQEQEEFDRLRSGFRVLRHVEVER